MGNPGKIVLVFEVYEGGEFQRREELSAESVTIGRGVAAMLRIDSPALADLQAVINVGDDGEVRLLDVVGADGGTKVNGAAVNNCVLRTGDEMAFGSVRVKVAVIDAGAFSDDEATQLGKVVDLSKGAVAAAPAAALERSAAPADDDDDAEESEAGEDVVAFIMRSGTSTSDAGIDKKLPKVLEVAEAWSNTLLDVKHYAEGLHRAVTIGSSAPATRWRVAGPRRSLGCRRGCEGRPFAWLAGPTISEADRGVEAPTSTVRQREPARRTTSSSSSPREGGSWYANVSDKWDRLRRRRRGPATAASSSSPPRRPRPAAPACGPGRGRRGHAPHRRHRATSYFFAQVVPPEQAGRHQASPTASTTPSWAR
jgi:hypothetical protein